LKLAITTSSGLFKGTVADPNTGKTISANGVVLQKQNFGGGFFTGTNQTGRVFFCHRGPKLINENVVMFSRHVGHSNCTVAVARDAA